MTRKCVVCRSPITASSRDFEVTSYAELVLAPQATDDAHPAFSKLFVETEFVPEAGALLATAPAPCGQIRKSGPRISSWSRAAVSAHCNSRPIVRASWVVVGASARRVH